jgi:hypothetical protein
MIDWECGHDLIWFKWLFMRTEVMIDPIWSNYITGMKSWLICIEVMIDRDSGHDYYWGNDQIGYEVIIESCLIRIENSIDFDWSLDKSG